MSTIGDGSFDHPAHSLRDLSVAFIWMEKQITTITTLTTELAAEKERRCVAESQVENADINPQQVQMALRSQLSALAAIDAARKETK